MTVTCLFQHPSSTTRLHNPTARTHLCDPDHPSNSLSTNRRALWTQRTVQTLWRVPSVRFDDQQTDVVRLRTQFPAQAHANRIEARHDSRFRAGRVAKPSMHPIPPTLHEREVTKRRREKPYSLNTSLTDE
jgi:hypothetical protein